MYSPVAVVPLLCGNDAALPFLRRHWMDLNAASAPAVSADRPAAEQQCLEWFRRVVSTETRAAHERLRVDVTEAPARADDELMLFYCPRCHAQFGAGCSECAACPGTNVVAFAARENVIPDASLGPSRAARAGGG